MTSYAPIIAHGKYRKGQIFAWKRAIWKGMSIFPKRLKRKQSLKNAKTGVSSPEVWLSLEKLGNLKLVYISAQKLCKSSTFIIAYLASFHLLDERSDLLYNAQKPCIILGDMAV